MADPLIATMSVNWKMESGAEEGLTVLSSAVAAAAARTAGIPVAS